VAARNGPHEWRGDRQRWESRRTDRRVRNDAHRRFDGLDRRSAQFDALHLRPPPVTIVAVFLVERVNAIEVGGDVSAKSRR
jgi:hypothetical protein